MKLPIQLLRRFALKPRRRLNIERGRDKRLNTELSALRYAQPSSIGMANTLDAVRAITPSLVSAPRRSLHKRLYPKLCCAAVVTLVGTAAAYWVYIERPPAIPEGWWATATKPLIGTPDPTIPPLHPNAYEVYNFLIQTVDLGDIGLLPHFSKGGEWEESIRYSSDNPDRIPMEDHKRIAHVGNAILAKNIGAMYTLRSALDSSYVDSQRWIPYDKDKPPVSFKKLWSLLMLNAYLASDGKRYAEAAEAALNVMQLATQIQTNTTVGPKITGLHWQVPARAFLWDALPHLNAMELRRVISRLDRVMVLNQMTAVDYILMNERIHGTQELLQLFTQPNWRWKLAQDYSRDGSPTTFWDFLRTCRYSKRQILANYDKVMLEEIAWSRKPYSVTRARVKNVQDADPASGFFVAGYSATLYFDVLSRTQNQLLRTQASILNYKLEKGNLPASLADLHQQERHLTNNHHTDLFAVREGDAPPLRYLRKNGGFVLYSVGPDMKDNGGRAICNPDKSASYNAVLQDSRGDIVAGVNRNFR